MLQEPLRIDYRTASEVSRPRRWWRRFWRGARWPMMVAALLISMAATMHVWRELEERAVQREIDRWAAWQRPVREGTLVPEERAELLEAAARALRHRDDRVHRGACFVLGHMFNRRYHEIALEPELRRATLDPDPRRRGDAAPVFLLVAMRSEDPAQETFARVVELLHDPNPNTARAAENTLVAWSGGGRPIPSEGLTPLQSRARAIVVPWLLMRLNDPNPRGSSIQSMGAMLPRVDGGPFYTLPAPDAGRSVFDPDVVLPKLAEVVADPSSSGRWQAVRTIEAFGSEAVPLLPVLEEALEEVYRSGDPIPVERRLGMTLERAITVIRHCARRDGVPIEPAP